MAEQLHPVHSSLALAAAAAIVDEAIAVRIREGLLPLAVAVLDAGGNLVAFKREDGSGVLRYDIAVGKAAGALGMGMSSRSIRDRMGSRPGFQNALSAASGGRFIPVPGGVLILDAAGAAIGAVGISGDASDKDEYCAIVAVKAAGYASEPAEPDPEWRAAGL
jgi:glc operon protein GlcG